MRIEENNIIIENLKKENINLNTENYKLKNDMLFYRDKSETLGKICALISICLCISVLVLIFTFILFNRNSETQNITLRENQKIAEEDLKDHIDKSSKEIESKNSQLTDLQFEIENKNQSLNALTQKVEELKQIIKDKDDTINSLKSKTDSQKDQDVYEER